MAFLSVRLSDDVRDRVEAIAAQRGVEPQDLVGDLIEHFLHEAERRAPDLPDVLLRLRAAEAELRAKGIAAVWIFGSVARGEAQPGSDVDLVVEFGHGAGPSLLAIAHLKDEFEATLGHPVNVGERAAMKPRVALTAERDMVRAF